MNRTALLVDLAVLLQSYAKINLHLKVFEKTPSGYHRLQTLMAKIGWCDELEVHWNDSDNVRIHCPGYPEISQKDNILYKTVKRFEKKTQKKIGLDIKLTKNIPLGAGLGGGSGNAATLLRYLNDHFDGVLDENDLAKLAFSLGADVPFFLKDHQWAVYGDYGQTLERFGTCEKLFLVLCYPDQKMDTAKMYKKLSRPLTWPHDSDKSPTSCYHVQKWADFERVLPFVNDFEAVVSEPWLEEIKMKFRSKGAMHAQLSGSGSVVFGLFDQQDQAHRAFEALSSHGLVYVTHVGI